jgi:hypothetical protein
MTAGRPTPAEYVALLISAGVDPCEDGTHNHVWRSGECGCPTCGGHDCVMCTVCLWSIDSVDSDTRELYQAILATQTVS